MERNFTDYNNLHSITFRPCGVQTAFADNALKCLSLPTFCWI